MIDTKIMRRAAGLMIILSFWLLFPGCAQKKAPAYGEDDLLLLGNNLPFGLTYQEVKEQFPEIGPARAEGGLQDLGDIGLTEAVLKLELLGHRAELEFNFNHDQLYSYYFFILCEDAGVAEKLYQYLQDFYGGRLGAFSEEAQEEGGFSTVSSYWDTCEFQFGLTLTRQKHIGWGWSSPSVF